MEKEIPLTNKAAVLDFFKGRISNETEVLREIDPENVVAELKAISGKNYIPDLLLLTRRKINCPDRPKGLHFDWINLSGTNVPAFPSRQNFEIALQKTLKLSDVWDADVIGSLLGEAKITEPLNIFWKKKMPQISSSLILVNNGNVYLLLKRSVNVMEDEIITFGGGSLP